MDIPKWKKALEVCEDDAHQVSDKIADQGQVKANQALQDPEDESTEQGHSQGYTKTAEEAPHEVYHEVAPGIVEQVHIFCQIEFFQALGKLANAFGQELSFLPLRPRFSRLAGATSSLYSTAK